MNRMRTEDLNEGRGVALLWLISLLGPVVWLVQLQTNYVLAYWVCRSGNRLVYPLVGLIALAVLAWGGWVAWSLRRLGKNEPMEDSRGRILLMTAAGMAGCAFFSLVVIATSIPGLLPGGCL